VRSEALTVAWSARVIRGDPGGAASALLEENIDVARALGDPYYLAHALLEHSDRSALEECVRLAHVTANPSTLAYALTLLGAQLAIEDAPRAKTLLDEAISYAASVNNEQAGAFARGTLTMVLPQLGGDPRSAALAALGSAARLLGTAERFYGFQLIATVAVTLDDLGADESARFVRAWLIDKGFEFAPQAGTGAPGYDQAVPLAGQMTDAVVRDLRPRVATMTDADVVAMCRAALED
jgi:hypothetical protein